MSRLIDMTGQTFGRLTVIEKVGGGRRTHWRCQCTCGGETIVMRDNLIKKQGTVSCGCHRTECLAGARSIHGLSTTCEHATWRKLIDRCENPNYPRFDRYGGRGIKVCRRWRKDFAAFYADMGPRPSSHHQIDRIDNDGNYEPGNCRWATRDEQMGNRSTSIMLEAFGRKQCIGQWQKETGVDRRTIHRRMKKLGMTLEQALAAQDWRHR